MTDSTGTTSYVYNGLNQLLSKTKGDETTTYTYDGRGNQVAEVTPEGTTNFTYAVTGEMLTASNGDTLIQENEYSCDGTRISKTEGSIERQYIYDNGSIAYTLDNGAVSSSNILGGYQNVIGSFRGSEYFIYNKDIQGSTSSIFDSQLSAENVYEYSDFGEVEVVVSGIDNEICYTGAVYDETTGLHYMNARYYDPSNGRFISQDSYRGSVSEPGQWHLYVYCANNPINYTDPSGHARKTNTSIPKTGSKIWICFKTTKADLRDRIAPFYKHKSTEDEFGEWFMREVLSGGASISLEKKDKAIQEFILNMVGKHATVKNGVINLIGISKMPIVGVVKQAYGLGTALYNGELHKIWEKIDAFYKKNLYGKKVSDKRKVFFCTQMTYRRKGSSGGFLPTTNVELHLNNHKHIK